MAEGGIPDDRQGAGLLCILAADQEVAMVKRIEREMPGR